MKKGADIYINKVGVNVISLKQDRHHNDMPPLCGQC